MEEIRLNKYLSEMGVCSRREADRLIAEGKVLVDGEKAVMGMKVTEGQSIICDGRPVGTADFAESRGNRKAERSEETGAEDGWADGTPGPDAEEIPAEGRRKKRKGLRDGRPKPVLLAVHKPRGVVCTTSQKDRALNIVDMVHYPVRVYPAGRLDKDSEGLIFLTNQGDLVNRIMRGSQNHEKEYVVTVNQPVTSDFIEKMKAGIWLKELKVQTKPCKAWISGKREFHIVLTQGLNRQIRRMCGALGYQVQVLKRIRIMNVRLGNLKAGTFRKVTEEEYAELLELLEYTEDRENTLEEAAEE